MPIRQRASSAFTLVELLVVIGIIALLISVLLPTLSKARDAATSVACKSLLRQYALASTMYVNENRGTCVDIYQFLDFDKGLLRYLGQKNETSAKLARCPGDQATEDMGRLGEIGGAGVLDAYKPRNAQGAYYAAKVSIGCNENATSASLQLAAGGATPARWQKMTRLRTQVCDVTNTMTWSDFQNNRGYPATVMAATVGTGLYSNTASNASMGSVIFRHRGAFNAAFLDGHVGEVRTKKRLTASGADLAPGEDWGTYAGTTPATAYGTYASHKVFYPFGPGLFKGGAFVALDTMQAWDVR